MTFEELVAKVRAHTRLAAVGDHAIVEIVGVAIRELSIQVDEASGELSQNPVASPLGWKAPEDNWRKAMERHGAARPRRRR